MSLMHIEAGDRLVRVYRGREETEVEVTRVGRKYLYIKVYSREVAYDRETGRVRSDVTYSDRVATREILDAEKRRHELVLAINEHGWGAYRYARVEQDTPLEKLEAILAVLDG